MDAIRELALKIGADTTKSASESADAMEMLAKNGIAARDILGGVARSTVALSEATGGDLSEAADVATNAMVIFGIKAGEMEKAVDGITGVVTSSQVDINDHALAISQVGAVAHSAGMDFKEFKSDEHTQELAPIRSI